jgi:hypothetical protein
LRRTGFSPFKTTDYRVEVGHEQQRGDVPTTTPPMTARASTAFCSSPGRRLPSDHADDHRSRHQHGPQTRRASGCGLKGARSCLALLTRKCDEQDPLAEATPIDMIAPISDSTLSVVPVRTA